MAEIHPLPLAALVICAGVSFAFAMRYDPMRPSGKMTALFARGAALLGIWNLMLPAQRIGLNAVTLLLSGMLGLPGTALSAFLQII